MNRILLNLSCGLLLLAGSLPGWICASDARNTALIAMQHNVLDSKSGMLGIIIPKFPRLIWNLRHAVSAYRNFKNGGLAAENWERWGKENDCSVAYEIAVEMKQLRELNAESFFILDECRRNGAYLCGELAESLREKEVNGKKAKELFAQFVAVNYMDPKALVLPKDPKFWSDFKQTLTCDKQNQVVITHSAEYLKAAQSVGFDGFVYQDPAQLRKELQDRKCLQ
jgi:hypothetical protein